MVYSAHTDTAGAFMRFKFTLLWHVLRQQLLLHNLVKEMTELCGLMKSLPHLNSQI